MQENEKPVMNLEKGENDNTPETLTENNTPEQETPQPQVEQPIVYKRADLHLKCSCGSDVTLDKGLEGGIRIMLPATDKHTLTLNCDKCKTTQQLYWIENTEVVETLKVNKDDTEIEESQNNGTEDATIVAE